MTGVTPIHGTAGAHGDRPKPWAGALTSAPTPTPPVKHCWYDGPHGRQAALLLGWRQINDDYSGRIVVAVLEPGGWVVVEMVVQSEMLSP